MPFAQLFPAKQVEVPKSWKHIVCFSGGVSSALTGVEVARKYGTKNLVLLNHNITSLVEDVDIKRFKREIASYIGVKITYANAENWKTNTQFDVCIEAGAFKTPRGDAICTSRMKTQPFNGWLEENIPDKQAVLYYGFDANELDRINRRKQIMGVQGWTTDYPLAFWERTIEDTSEIGIVRPSVYAIFRHGNCQGCLKAGVQHWYVIYCTRKDIWELAKHAEEEIGHSILKDGYLITFECKFALMQQAGIPASEQIPFGKFWRDAEAILGVFVQQHDVLPCECTW
jgi:hypothetical protein